VLGAKEELSLELDVAESAELLRDPMLFAVRAGALGPGRTGASPSGHELGTKYRDTKSGKDENSQNGKRAQNHSLHVLLSCE
jgi:hypothetical protein